MAFCNRLSGLITSSLRCSLCSRSSLLQYSGNNSSLNLGRLAAAHFGTVNLAFNKYDADTVSHERHTPLVIMHGLFGHKQNWNSVAKALNRRLRITVFTLDLRNHGESPWTKTMSYSDMAADVALFLREIVPEEIGAHHEVKVHLLGHSMGGKTAMKIALSSEGGELLRSLIVEDIVPKKYATSNHLEFPKYLKAMRKVDLSKTRHQINLALEPAIKDFSTRQFLLTNLVGTNGNLHWRLNMDAIEKYIAHVCDVENTAGQYNGPAIFISGENSPYLSTTDHSLILSLFPNARFSVIKNSGHWVHAEKPYEFMDEVEKFVSTIGG